MKKYHSYKGEVGRIVLNLLQRNFHADKPNLKLVTNAREFSLFGEKLYLSPILDLYNSDLIGYTISTRPVLSMVTSMLDKVFEQISDATIDSSLRPRLALTTQTVSTNAKNKGICQSMSRKGNCLDNAVMKVSSVY